MSISGPMTGSENTSEPLAHDILLRKRRVLGGLILLLTVCFGAHVAMQPSGDIGSLFLVFTLGILATFYCLTDAQLLGKPFPPFAGWIIFFFFWPLVVPVCLFYKRGRKGIVKTLLSLAAVVGVFLFTGIIFSLLRMALTGVSSGVIQ